MLKRFVVSSLIVTPLMIGAAAPSRAQDFVVQDHQLTASRPVSLLNGWACWFGDGSFANCHMETTKKPQLGALRVAVKPATIPSSGGTCAGRATPGLYVTYTPRPGVHGTDTVELRSIADNGGRHLLRYTITVP
jgi:hypothetical protein